MLDLAFRAAAADDLITIFRYGAEEFGAAVALDWRDGLDQILRRLREFPAIGRARPELGPGLRCWAYRSHMIFYLADEDVLTVARVLHQRAWTRIGTAKAADGWRRFAQRNGEAVRFAAGSDG